MARASESMMMWRLSSLTLVVMVGTLSFSCRASSSQDNSSPHLKLSTLSSPSHQDDLGEDMSLGTAAPSLGKNRRVREIRDIDDGDLTPLFNQDYSPVAHHGHQQPILTSVSSSSPKVKGFYPPLSGSGELLRLFRPLALSPDKAIGMTRWYLPGFGYFSRGGRASSNFIRFGRSGGAASNSRFVDEGSEDDLSSLSRNNAKKKNNFIRLGRENPRQTSFIRLGRSGGSSPPEHPATGEFYNSGYITPSLSDTFRGVTAEGIEDGTVQDRI